MTDEHVRRQISGILTDLDVSFSMKRDGKGNSQWTVEFISDDRKIEILISASESWILTFYFHDSVQREPDSRQLTRLLALNWLVGANTKVSITDAGYLIAWSKTIYSTAVTKEVVQNSLNDTLDAARRIIEIVPE